MPPENLVSIHWKQYRIYKIISEKNSKQVGSNKKKINKNLAKNKDPSAVRFISIHYLTEQFSTKSHGTCKEAGKSITNRKKKQPRENVLQKAQILDLIDTDFWSFKEKNNKGQKRQRPSRS